MTIPKINNDILIELFNDSKNIVTALCMAIVLIVGMAGIFSNPPTRNLDEMSHFVRSAEISNGWLLYNKDGDNTQWGGFVDESYSNFWKYYDEFAGNQKFTDGCLAVLKSAHYCNNEIFIATTNTCPYIPIVYLPYVIPGIFCVMLHCDPLITYMVMRFFSFLFYFVLSCLILKINKNLRYVFSLFMISPLYIVSISHITADAYTLITIMLFCACLSKYVEKVYRNSKISIKETIVLAAACVFLSMSKIPSVCFSVLCLPICYFIIRNKHSCKKLRNFAIIILLTVVICCLGVFCWIIFIRDMDVSGFCGPGNYYQEQLNSLFNDPIDFLRKLVLSVASLNFFDVSAPFIKNSSYALSPFVCFIFYLVLFSNSSINDKQNAQMYEGPLVKNNKMIFLFTIILTIACYVFLVYLMEFLKWTTPTSVLIDGVQPRYMFSLFVVIVSALCYSKVTNIELNPYISLVTCLIPLVFYSLSMV